MAEKTDTKTRKPPLEIDRAQIRRLMKRIDELSEARTQSGVRRGVPAGVYVAISKQREEAMAALISVLALLSLGKGLPDAIATKDSPEQSDEPDKLSGPNQDEDGS